MITPQEIIVTIRQIKAFNATQYYKTLPQEQKEEFEKILDGMEKDWSISNAVRHNNEFLHRYTNDGDVHFRLVKLGVPTKSMDTGAEVRQQYENQYSKRGPFIIILIAVFMGLMYMFFVL